MEKEDVDPMGKHGEKLRKAPLEGRKKIMT